MKALELKPTRRLYLYFAVLGGLTATGACLVALNSNGVWIIGRLFVAAMAVWAAAVTIWACWKFLHPGPRPAGEQVPRENR